MDATSYAHKLVDEALAKGEIDADRDRQFRRWINIHGQFLHLLGHYKRSDKSFFKADELLPDFVVSSDPPVFFKQMEEDEFKNYDIEYPRFQKECYSPVVDYCYQMHYTIVGGSVHRQTGLPLDCCAGKNFDKRLPKLLEDEKVDNPVNRYMWHTVNERSYENKPHTIAVLSQLIENREEYILRSELIVLLEYIRRKMPPVGGFSQDEISPVLLISIRSEFLRVIECYYDGEKLHLHYGFPVHTQADVPLEERDSRLGYILRWFGSTPQGETKKFSSLKPTDSRSSSSATSGNSPTPTVN